MASQQAASGLPDISKAEMLEMIRTLPDVVFRCHKEPDGRIYWSFNEGRLAEEFGVTTQEIRGKSLEELFPGGASEQLREHFEAAFRGEAQEFINEMGGRFFKHFPQPVRGTDGRVAYVVGFISEVTHLVEAERRLKEKNAELEAFTYSVSHDLRNPLAVLMNLTEALRAGKDLDAGKREKALGRMTAVTQRMEETIEGLLGLSRAGRTELERTEVDLSGMARQVADDLEQQDPDRRQGPDRQVRWRIEPRLEAWADAGLARVLLENLLGNAWKYTRDTGSPEIEVVAEERDGRRWFVVRDNGPGFDPGIADRLFVAFERVDNRDIQGSGIGLATVKRIVERHDGAVQADAVPGEGSVFRFHLGAHHAATANRPDGMEPA